MDYTERYLREVGKLLPKSGREEKLLELRSELKEAVARKKSKSNFKNMDPTEYEEQVINELGSPALLAKKYGGGYRPLISEEAMPIYLLVIKIVAIVHGVLILVIWGTAGFDISRILGIASGMVNSLLSNAAIITIVFYFLDRKKKFGDNDWKIKDLPELPKEDRVKVPEQLISIGINSFFLMYFLLFPEWLGYGFYIADQWVFQRMAGGFLIDFLPLISILIITRIFLNVMAVRKEYFTMQLRLLEILQAIAVITLSGVILNHGTDLVFESSTGSTVSLGLMFSRVARIIFYVIIGASLLHIGKHVYRLVKKENYKTDATT